MSGFKAIYVYIIFAILAAALPTGVYFTKVRKLRTEWKKTLDERNTNRQVYKSNTNFTGLWPTEGREDKRTEEGKKDKADDDTAKKKGKQDKEKTWDDAKKERDAHKKLYDALMKQYMRGINRDRFRWDRPDDLVLEMLKLLRDEEGPRLIQFLDKEPDIKAEKDKQYRNLFFRWPIPVPPPNLNINSAPASLPVVGPFQRLSWPVGVGPLPFTVWGTYDDLLRFVETFPKRYDRIALISSFSLQRLAFDWRKSVLLQLACTIEFFVWPDMVPGSPGGPPGAAAPPPGPPGGAPPPPPGGGAKGGAAKGGKAKGDDDDGGGGGKKGGLKSKKAKDEDG